MINLFTFKSTPNKFKSPFLISFSLLPVLSFLSGKTNGYTVQLSMNNSVGVGWVPNNGKRTILFNYSYMYNIKKKKKTLTRTKKEFYVSPVSLTQSTPDCNSNLQGKSKKGKELSGV